ncbi:hypothetical protein BGZ76_007679 [Entomortierella beljakovae]|nr:hypothetical protein BGZ76_007679 [Entomortierella beljakovae]
MSRPMNSTPKKGNRRKLMNSMVNIPSTNPDPYFRYKMPALEIRINPARIRTNNAQRQEVEVPASTQTQNLPAIAKALNRPIEYISKFFELELEMQGQMDIRQRWFKLCAGVLTEQELMLVLDKFIRRFVLCFICNNPETALTIYNTYIIKECGACGQSTRVDRFTKLTRYIIRNRNFGLGFAHVPAVDATKCRFLKEGVVTATKGTVMNAAAGFKNGVRVATATEIADDEEEEDEDEENDQDWSLDTSAEAVAERRLRELELITRVEKIMNAAAGEKARDPYKLFEEYVITPGGVVPESDQEATLPDKDEVLGRFYTLDLEKEGAIFILERLHMRHQQQQQENTDEKVETEVEQKLPFRDDYDEMIQILKNSLEREVVVSNTLESSSDQSSSDDDDDDDENSDSSEIEDR